MISIAIGVGIFERQLGITLTGVKIQTIKQQPKGEEIVKKNERYWE